VLAFGNAVAIRDARTVLGVTDRLLRIAHLTGAGRCSYYVRSAESPGEMYDSVLQRFSRKERNFAEKLSLFLTKAFVVLLALLCRRYSAPSAKSLQPRVV